MNNKPPVQKPQAYRPIFKIILGLVPGTIIAIYSYNGLLQPELEIAGLIPIFILTIGGFVVFLIGGILFVILLISGRRSYFSIGIGLGGLIMLAAFLLATYIIPWL